MEKVVFGLVGGGWRAEFYLRIARELPEQFAVGAMFVRNKEKAEALSRTWGVRVYTTIGDFISAAFYSFAVVSLKKDISTAYVIRLAEMRGTYTSHLPQSKRLN